MTAPKSPYTPIVRAGDWLIVSGQVGVLDGKLVSGGVVAELTQAMANMQALLVGEGSSLDQVTKTTVFMRHMRDYALINAAYTEAFGDHRPARSAVAVSELPFHALVEVEAWAYVGS